MEDSEDYVMMISINLMQMLFAINWDTPWEHITSQLGLLS